MMTRKRTEAAKSTFYFTLFSVVFYTFLVSPEIGAQEAKITVMAAHDRGAGAASVIVSPDGKTLVIYEEKRAVLKDLANGSEIGTLAGGPFLHAFSEDAAFAAVASRTGPGAVWELATGRSIQLELTAPVMVSFSKDSLFLITAAMDGSIRKFDTKTGKETSRMLTPGLKSAVHFKGTPLVAAGDREGYIHFWDTENATLLHSFQAFRQPAETLIFNSAPPLLISQSRFGETKIFSGDLNELFQNTGDDLRKKAAEYQKAADELNAKVQGILGGTGNANPPGPGSSSPGAPAPVKK